MFVSRDADAQISPLVPPVPCCTGNWKSCPSAAAACIPIPYAAVGDPELAADPSTATPWHLTVHEAIRIALGNSEAVRNLGLVEARSDVDIIRALMTTYDPQIADALAAAEWGIFDPLWTTVMQWDRIDIPPGTSFSGIGNRPPELDTADFYTSLEQLLPGGTKLRADYVTDYLFNPDHPPSLDPNPQYFSYAQFGLTQPILQGFGVNVTMAPIRIAAAEAEQTDWQFKQEMLALVRSIETAFWTLYAEQRNLRALDEALPLFREIVRVRQEQARGEAGTETEAARALSEMLLYEQRRLDALSNIAEQQLVLRNLMGLAPNDGRYLALVALPVTTPPFQTVGDAIMTAVNQRPDVLRQRLAVYVAQQERIIGRDALRPQLDFNAFWRINGLGEDLPESWDVLGQNDFHDWHMGVLLQVPLGRRQARANLRAAELTIQKERALLDQTAHQAAFEVADAYRRIIWLSQQNRVSSERVAALIQWRQGARAHFENPPPGVSTVFALEMYLNNLRDFVEASIKSNAIIADYNSALARLEEVKGTLLESRLVEVAGDPTDAVPEELPTPQIQVPEWMTPPPAELERTAPQPGANGAAAPGAQVLPSEVRPAPTVPGPAELTLPETHRPVLSPVAQPKMQVAAPPIANTTPDRSISFAPKTNEPREFAQPDLLTNDSDDSLTPPVPSAWRQPLSDEQYVPGTIGLTAPAPVIARSPAAISNSISAALPQGTQSTARAEPPLDNRITKVVPPADQNASNAIPAPATNQPVRRQLAASIGNVELPRAGEVSSPSGPSSVIVLNPPAARLAPPATEQKLPEIALTEPSRIDFRFKAVDRVGGAGSKAASSNLSLADITETDAPGAIKFDDLYEIGDTVSDSTVLHQPSDQLKEAHVPAPLTGLDQFYLESASPQATLSISRYISPLHDNEAPPPTEELPTSGRTAQPLRNPEEARVAAVPSDQPNRSSDRVDALLEPDTMYFEAAGVISPPSAETQLVLPESTSTTETKNSSQVDHLTIALLPGPGRDVWLSDSSSDSSSAPLHSLYDPAAGFSGGPASLTASTFANVSSAARQSTKRQSTSTAPRPQLRSIISCPDEGTTIPDGEAQVPPQLAYPQWVGQADANVKMRQRPHGPSQQLINPTFYGVEADGQQ
ncbi:MAG TPA: TolC family protein [Lacipirellulaceae bacterium]|nr:TolC family protein [Lacipirellulaceae bacterium]